MFFVVSSHSSRDPEMTYPWVSQRFDGRSGFLANCSNGKNPVAITSSCSCSRLPPYFLCAYDIISCYILYVYSISSIFYPLACVLFKMETSVFHGNIFLSFLRWLEQRWCEAKKQVSLPKTNRKSPWTISLPKLTASSPLKRIGHMACRSPNHHQFQGRC